MIIFIASICVLSVIGVYCLMIQSSRISRREEYKDLEEYLKNSKED